MREGGRKGRREEGREGGREGGRGASINAASRVWKKISPPSFINLQDIKAGQQRRGAHARAISVHGHLVATQRTQIDR